MLTGETIRLPEATRVPGLHLRHWRGIDSDLPAMHAVADATRRLDGEIERMSFGAMRAWYEHLERCDPENDLAIVELDGRVVGYTRVEWQDTNDGERWFECTAYLHPDARGRGVGTAMLAWSERRRLEIAAAQRAAGEALDRPWRLTTFTFGGDERAARLLERSGYERFRGFHSMVRPHLADIPSHPLPGGLEIRPIPRERHAMWRVFKADAEAFRDHFGWIEDSEEAFLSFIEDPETDPSLWLVAFDGDEIAGGVLNGIHVLQDGTRQGWLDSVFTRRPWRRRGLARALIARSLALLRNRGLEAAYIGVDAQNPNQALGLYESNGFRVVSSAAAWRKPLEPGV